MIPFYKMHANGNDFMIIESMYHNISLPHSTILKKWADRHTGIGFDQLLYLSKVTDNRHADVVCRIFNASGTEAEQCGHGMACLAQWLYQYGGLQKSTYQIATPAELCTVQRVDEERVIVNLGIPVLEPSKIPFITKSFDLLYPVPLSVDTNTDLKMHCLAIKQQQYKLLPQKLLNPSLKEGVWVGALGIGNPHCVVPVANIDYVSMDLAQGLSESPQFPSHTNVEFMEIIDNTRIKVRVYERGVGENRACGTGACAAMIVGRLLGYLRSIVHVEFESGDEVMVHWNRPQTEILLHTNTQFVFQGVCL